MTKALEAKRTPSLYWTEGKLAEAHRMLEAEMEAKPNMTADEAAAFVAQIIPSLAVTSNRDAFARFLLEADAQAEAKNKIAEAYIEQANRIKRTLLTMRDSVTRSMRASGVEKLAGDEHVLVLRTGPPRVEVDDETRIPEAFMRTTVTKEGERIERLWVLMLAITGYGVVAVTYEDAAIMQEAEGLVEQSRAERRAPDKNAIKAAWKEAGGVDAVEQIETAGVDGSLVPATRAPVVPGCHMERTYSLEVR